MDAAEPDGVMGEGTSPDPYRSASPPEPRTFRLRPHDGARLGMILMLATLAVALVVLYVTGVAFLLVLGLFGAPLAYVLDGAPRAIEVRADEVVLSYVLRRQRVLPVRELMVQQTPEELIFVHGTSTFGIGSEHFPGGSFGECAAALREVVARFVVRTPQRPIR